MVRMKVDSTKRTFYLGNQYLTIRKGNAPIEEKDLSSPMDSIIISEKQRQIY